MLKDKVLEMQSIESSNENAKPYERFTVRMAVNLAAPHTWPAAILPVALSVACACAVQGAASISLSITLLAICILMQSSVNTFNDYYDYVKGSDSADDDVDPSDAVLVYNNVNPSAALRLAIGMLVCAFALGVYVIARTGWIPLAIGIVGALFVVAYSAGKTPISYLPIGEFVSGFVMGGLIPLACFYVLTETLSPIVLVWSIPTIIGIGLIMMTNNTCDIEKDIAASRKTLPVLLGRKRARNAYHACVIVWALAIIINLAVFFRPGLILVPFMILSAYPLLKVLFANPLAASSRVAGMGQICSVNIALGSWYAACVLSSMATLTW